MIFGCRLKIDSKKSGLHFNCFKHKQLNLFLYAVVFILAFLPRHTSAETTYLVSNGDGTYDIVTYWSSTGNYTFTQTINNVRVLVVGGGGGGGGAYNNSSGGGGGAGGFVTGTINIIAGDHMIVVGSGGAAGVMNSSVGSMTAGSNGGNSSFLDMNSTYQFIGWGGGGGGTSVDNGKEGGSGGGAGVLTGTVQPGTARDASAGHNGGNQFISNSAGSQASGGGGGAGSVGVSGIDGASGNGGDGLSSDISGTLRYYAAGGGGGKRDNGTFGIGGSSSTGGNGAGGSEKLDATAPKAMTGSGGGGGAGVFTGGVGNYDLKQGSAGADGIVIVRYAQTTAVTITAVENSTVNQPGVVGEVVSISPSVKVTNSAGTPIKGIEVSFTVTEGNGTISQNSIDTNALGVATLGAWTLGTVAGTNKVEASVNGVNLEFTAVSVAGAATKLSINPQPGAVNSEAILSPAPIIYVQDQYGNTDLTYNSPINVSVILSSGAGSGAGALNMSKVDAVNGVADFAGLILSGKDNETYQLEFTSPTAGIQSVSSNDLVPTGPGPLNQLTIRGPPINSVKNGDVLASIDVAVEDKLGNLVTAESGQISVSASSNVTLTGSTLEALSNGIASFDDLVVTGKNGATYNLTFSYQDALGNSYTTDVTLTIAGVGVATNLDMTVAPVPSVSGNLFTTKPVITVKDSGGNTVTSAAGTIDAALFAADGSALTGKAALSGTTQIQVVSGVGTFNDLALTGQISTDYLLRFIFTDPNFPAPLSIDATVSVTGAGNAAQMLITQQPQGTKSGATLTQVPIVEIQDSYGNRVDTYASNVTVSTTNAGWFTNNEVTPVNGVAEFNNLIFNGLINVAYEFTFNSGSLPAVNSDPLTLTEAGTPNKIKLVTPPVMGKNGEVFPTPPVVSVQDVDGNLVNNATNLITVSKATGPDATLTGNSINAVNGVADFQNLVLNGKISVPYTLEFSSPGLVSDFTGDLTLTEAGVAVKLNVSTPPIAGQSGGTFSTPAAISLFDENDNLVESNNVEISVALPAGSSGDLQNVTAQTVNGIATFTNLILKGRVAESYTLTFSSNTITDITADVSLTGPGKAFRLEIVAPPTAVANGAPFNPAPSVQIVDEKGNIIENSTATVTAEVNNGGILTNATAPTPVQGIATFTGLTLNGQLSKSYTITFTSSSLQSVSAPAVSLTGPGALAQLAITTQPLSDQNGEPMNQQPVIQLQDVNGNLISNSTAIVNVVVSTGGLLNQSQVQAVGGVATFSGLQLNGTINQPYVLTFSSGGLPDVASDPITMTLAGRPHKLNLRAPPPAAGINGGVFSAPPIIEIQDIDSNFVSAATNIITAEIASGPAGSLTNNVVNANAGVANFSALTLSGTVGQSYILRFTSPGLSEISSAPLNLFGPSAAYKLFVNIKPAGGQSGAALTTQPEIYVQDVNGNLVTSSTVEVAVSVTNRSDGTLTNDSMRAVSGIARYTNLTLEGVIETPYELTFSASGLLSATADVTLDSAGAASYLEVTRQPVAAVNGEALITQPEVTIKDVKGNVVKGSTALITAQVSSGATVTSPDADPAVEGIATFTNLAVSGKINTDYILTFTSPSLTDATSAPFQITTAGVAHQLWIVQQPIGTQSGKVLTQVPIIEVQDKNGNRVMGDTSDITVSSLNGGFFDTPLTASASDGQAIFGGMIFNGVLATDYPFTFTSTTVTGNVVSDPVRLSLAGDPNQLRVVQQPQGEENRAPLKQPPIVRINDKAGNWVNTATNPVSAQISSGPSGTLTNAVVKAVGGEATFSAMTLAGRVGSDYILEFSAFQLGSATSSPFSLTTASSAVKLSVYQAPVPNESGKTFPTPAIIRVQDADDNLVESSQADITVAVSGNKGELGNPMVQAEKGVATFTDLTLSGLLQEPYTLTFSSAGLNSISIDNIRLQTAGDEYKLVISQQPEGGKSGSPLLTPAIVQVQDRNGNLVLGSSALVTATVDNGGVISNQAVSAVAGEATFNNLLLSGKLGVPYTLTFESTSLINAVSIPIYLTSAGDPTSLLILEQPETLVSGEQFTKYPILLLADSAGNTVESSDVQIQASLIDTGLGAQLTGTTSVLIADRKATFTDLVLSGPVNNSYQLLFNTSDSTISTVTSKPMTLIEEGEVYNMFILSGNNQTGFVGTALPLPLEVKFVDVHNNGVEGATAEFSVQSGGGYLTEREGISDPEGIARIGQWVLGQTVGAQSVDVTSPVLPTVLETFTATSEPGVGTVPYFGKENEAIGTRFEPLSILDGIYSIDQGGVKATLSLRDINDSPLINNSNIKSVEVSIASGPGNLSSVTSDATGLSSNTYDIFSNVGVASNSGRSIILTNPANDPFYNFSVISVEPGTTIVAGRVTLTDGTQETLRIPLRIRFISSQSSLGSLRLIRQPEIDADGDVTVQPMIGLYDKQGVLQETINNGDVTAQLVQGTGSLLSKNVNNSTPIINGVAEYTQMKLISTIGESYKIGFFSPNYQPAISQEIRRKTAAELIADDVENLLLRDLQGKIDSKQEKFKSLSKAAIDRLRTYQAYDDYTIDCVPRYVKYENAEEAEKVKDIIARAEMMSAIQPHKKVAKNLFEDPISMFKFTSFKEWIKTIHQIQRDRTDVPTINLTPIPVEAWLAFKDQSSSAELVPLTFEERKKAVQTFIKYLLSLKEKRAKGHWITYAKSSPYYWLKITFIPKDASQRKKLNAMVFSNVNQWLKFLHQEKQEKAIGELDTAILDIAQNSALSLNDWFMFQTLYEQVSGELGDEASDERILDAMLVKMQAYVDEFEGIQDRAKSRKLQIKRSKVRVPITEDKIFTNKTDATGYWTLPGSCYFSSSQITLLEDKNADMDDWRFIPSDIGDGTRLDMEYRHRYGDGKTTWRQSIDVNMRVDVTEDLDIKQYEISQYVGWERRFENTNLLGFLLGWDVTQSDIQNPEIEGEIQSASISFGAYGAHIIDQFGLDYYLTLSVGSNSYRLNFVDGYAGTGSVFAKGAYQYVSLLAGLNASLERTQLFDFMYVQPNVGIQSGYAWTSATSLEAIQRDLRSQYKFDLKDYTTHDIYFDLATDYVFYSNKNEYTFLLHRINITPKAWYGENSLDIPRFSYGYTIDYSVLMDIHEVKLQYSLRENDVMKGQSYSFGYSADVGIGQVGISTELNERNESFSELDFESNF